MNTLKTNPDKGCNDFKPHPAMPEHCLNCKWGIKVHPYPDTQSNEDKGMNEKIGLPFGGMKKVAVCFDMDGTLIEGDEITHDSTLDLLRAFAYQDWKNLDVIVWSGGGADYARTQYRRITGDLDERSVKFHGKLEHEMLRQKYYGLIAIDDIQDTAIGDVNLIVRNK